MKRNIQISACLCAIMAVYALAPAQKTEMVSQTGHSFMVSSVAFSSDGKILASSSGDQTIKLWDVASGTELRTLRGHSEPVWCVVFSPDGKTLVSASADQTIKFWDVITGRELRTLRGHTEGVWSVTFSPDGKLLASTSTDKTIVLWDVASGTKLRTLQGHTDAVWSVVFSPDGKILASGSMDSTVRLWNPATGAELHTLKGHTDAIYSLTFDGGGKTLISGSPDKTIRIWDVATGKGVTTLTDPYGGVYSLALSPDRKVLASAGDGQRIVLWDLSSGRELRVLKGHSGVGFSGLIQSMKFDPDGRKLASGSWDQTIKLWDVDSGVELLSLKQHSSWVLSTAFSPDGRTLATGSWDNMVRLWDVTGGAGLWVLAGHSEVVRSVAFSPDGRVLASGSGDDTIKLWDVRLGTELRTLKGHSDDLEMVAYSLDGNTLASCSRDKTIKLWNVANGEEIRTLKGHSDAVNTLAFSRDGKTLASAGRDHTIKLWNFANGIESRALTGHAGSISTIVFSPDGLLLASSSKDHTVKLWDAVTGQLLHTLKGHSDWVYTVAFSPDGQTLASGGRDNTIILWDVRSRAQRRVLKANSGWIYLVSFSLDGKTLISSSLDAYLRFWSTADGAELASLVTFDERDWLVITPDGLFDGSPPAWNKINWRFENNTFKYVAVEAFFGDFFYPGLLTDIFAGMRPKAPSDIARKDRRQPQVSLTLAESKDARNAVVKIDVRHAPAGARDVRLFLNSSLIRVWHGDMLKGKSRVMLTATVPLVAGENRLTAYAFNRDNIKSSDASLVVNGAASLKRSGTLYVLAIGVNKYRSAGYDLKFAVADADNIGKQLKASQEKLGTYSNIKVISLSDEEATKANIMLALQRFAQGVQVGARLGTPLTLSNELAKIRRIEPEDGLVIFFAGHGTAIGQRFYLLPHNFVSGNSEKLKASSISDIELNRVLERIYAGKLLMIIDACQSGQALGGDKEGRGPTNSKGLAQLAYDKGMYVLTAAQSYQAAKEVSRSLAGEKIEHGLLTFALLEGLTSANPDSLGRITEREWMAYAVHQVPLMQIEELKKRELKIKSSITSGQRGEPVYVGINDDLRTRSVQRPRVFYRRELEAHSFIVAKP